MSAINDYMKEITEIDTLNIMEERKLFELIKDGDEDAKQKMIVSNLRLVAKIAHDYKGYGVPLEDLIGAGNVGLMKAVEKYEFGKGTKFSTYASLWIKNQIRREIDYVGRTISFCCNTLDKMRKIKKLKDDMGDDFNIEEVAKEMKSSKGYVACWANGYSQVSLNEPISSEDNHELGDIIADEKTDCVNDIIKNDFIILIEENYTKILDKNEIRVMEYRYGLNGMTIKTQKETAKAMGYTYQRIQQIEKNALKKLKKYLKTV
jgi:RNA polymerase primary sigma factor